MGDNIMHVNNVELHEIFPIVLGSSIYVGVSYVSLLIQNKKIAKKII
jgi:hypothetical protein